MEQRLPDTLRNRHLAAMLQVLLILAPPVALGAAPAFVDLVEHAAECPTLNLQLTSPSSGVILARRCDHCPVLTLAVDANTRVFSTGRSVTLVEADNNRDRGATVMFDPDTRLVTRILLRQ